MFVQTTFFCVHSYPFWFSKELKILIIQKKQVHLSYKNSQNISNYIIFSRSRDTFKRLAKQNYNNHVLEVQSKVNYNLKYF